MEWKEVRLGDVCNIITGFPFPGKKYSKEGIRVVRGDNVTIGNLRWDTEKISVGMNHSIKLSIIPYKLMILL